MVSLRLGIGNVALLRVVMGERIREVERTLRVRGDQLSDEDKRSIQDLRKSLQTIEAACNKVLTC